MSSPRARSAPAARRVFDVVVVGALALVAGVVGLVAVLDADIGAPTRSSSTVHAGRAAAGSPTTEALRLLRSWDTQRAAAYAHGSAAALRRLYVAGSPAGVADVRLLTGYRARRLRVVDMRTQVLALRVLEAGPDRWRLAVTDRLARADARSAGSRKRVVLPWDQPTTRVLTLVRGRGAWRVLSVEDA
jgi:hypothetical protein